MLEFTTTVPASCFYLTPLAIVNGTLTIASVTHNNTGVYQCFANNIHGFNSTLWVVIVKDPGECNVLTLYLLLCYVHYASMIKFPK